MNALNHVGFLEKILEHIANCFGAAFGTSIELDETEMVLVPPELLDISPDLPGSDVFPYQEDVKVRPAVFVGFKDFEEEKVSELFSHGFYKLIP